MDKELKAHISQLKQQNLGFEKQIYEFSKLRDAGMPSDILRAAGVVNKPMKLYGSKIISKQKKHGFKLEEIQNLPMAVAYPIAVFNNYQKDDNRSVLTELQTTDGNFLVSLNVGKDQDIDFNVIASVFGKGNNKVVEWLNKGYATYIDKEKALNYLHHSEPISEALSNSRLISATNIVQNFENPSIESKFSIRTPDTFYSNAEFAVRGIKQEKATPEQWLKMIEKSGGLKAGEDKWLGLSDWLKESNKKTLTKQEVLDYINANKIVVEDVEYGVQDYMSENEIYESDEYRALEESLLEYEDETPYIDKEKFKELRNKDEDFVDGFDVDYWGEQLLVKNPFAAARYLGISNVGKRINETRLQYTTNGLTNKREIALVVPTIEPWKADDDIHFGDAGYRKLAGEVESRNVEKRLGMTPEERRNTLLAETEDVARKDQIFILYGMEMAEKKKIAEETVSPKDSDHPAAISSATGAKILNNLDNLAKKYQEKTNRPDTFIGDVAQALDIEMRNKPSKYGTYLTISGDLITLRLSNHGATVSEFDARNEEEAISIVIDNKYKGGANDGNAHIVEYFYDARKLRKAEGKPLVDIIKSIKQTLYSGQYVDNTGLATRVEINKRFSLRNMVPTNEPVTFDNFYNRTAGIWEALPISEAPTRTPDYESRRWDGFGVSSRYWYGEDEGGQYIIRESDHWSRYIFGNNSAEDFKRNPYGKIASTPIASCRWALDGKAVATDSYKETNEKFKETYVGNKGRVYGKIYLQNLTHYKDASAKFSLRLPEYQERFKALTEEYNALDKNDAQAVADFRARKRTLVEEYWNDFAKALGADIQPIVVDSTNSPEVLLPIYDVVKEVKEAQSIKEEMPTFEEFVEYWNNDKEIAKHFKNTPYIILDVKKADAYNTQKSFTQLFLHEYIHDIIDRNVSRHHLLRIWQESATTDYGKALRKGYDEQTSAQLGSEVLAYLITGRANTNIAPLLDHIEGENNILAEDVLTTFGNSLPLRDNVATNILSILRNGYKEREGNQEADEQNLYAGGESRDLRGGAARAASRAPRAQAAQREVVEEDDYIFVVDTMVEEHLTDVVEGVGGTSAVAGVEIDPGSGLFVCNLPMVVDNIPAKLGHTHPCRSPRYTPPAILQQYDVQVFVTLPQHRLQRLGEVAIAVGGEPAAAELQLGAHQYINFSLLVHYLVGCMGYTNLLFGAIGWL